MDRSEARAELRYSILKQCEEALKEAIKEKNSAMVASIAEILKVV